jgi:hypothetical protein
MGRPSRHEIKRFADDQFADVREDILVEYEEKRKEALRQVRLTGNIGVYLPALVKWGAERVRSMVLALADACVEAFTIQAFPRMRWRKPTSGRRLGKLPQERFPPFAASLTSLRREPTWP